jgi:hypothetical protein
LCPQNYAIENVWGDYEMKIECAKKIHELAIKSITELTSILSIDNQYEEYEQIKKGVGLSIGKIQMDILEVLYKHFPELDDLE